MAAIVLGGVHCGVGKSSLAKAITEALRSQGQRVSAYTIGPGLPTCLVDSSKTQHLGRLPAGLDGWLLSQDAACACFHSLSADADISLIEGYLGMFESPTADGSEQGSTAQIAAWLRAPVVLIIDTQAFNTVRGIVALIKGYTAVDGGSSVAGVILNKVTNRSLAGDVQAALDQAAADTEVLGGIPKVESAGCRMTSNSSCPWSPRSTGSTGCSSCMSTILNQHQQPCEQQLVQMVQQYLDLQKLQQIAATAAVPIPQAPLPPQARTFRVSWGVAYDEAFFQYFQQNLHMLTLCGVQLVPFSPLHDKQLPPGLSAVLLGGGPVQDWLGQLSANSSMLQALRAFAAAGGLVVGEGAGLMYLSQSVQRPGQQMRYAMVGLFPFHTQLMPQIAAIASPSYVEVSVQQLSPHALLLPGSKLRGITTCHCQVVEERLVGGLAAALAAAADQQQASGSAYNSSNTESLLLNAQSAANYSTSGCSPPMTYSYNCMPLVPSGVAEVQEGYTCGTALASCVQVHYGSCPDVVQHMAQRCLRVDVASVTAAASAAAARAAETAAAAAALSRTTSDATAVVHHESALITPVSSPRCDGSKGMDQQQQATGDVTLTPSRAASAPNLQQHWYQQQCNAPAGPVTTAAEGYSAAGVAALCNPGDNNPAALSTRKSASIPGNMYQMGLEAQNQQYHQQQGTTTGHHSRTSSFGSSTQQQQHGWQPPLPIQIPKRWSLELQRLGSLTSQLIPGAKSPTGQQQQHSRSQPGCHVRNNSYGMVHLPEEAPLSDDAMKLLDSSLPVKLGRTHHTHIGLAVPLSGGGSSGGDAVAAGGSLAAQMQSAEGDMRKSCSIHEQMSQLAASLSQKAASATGSCNGGGGGGDSAVAGSTGDGAGATEAWQHQQKHDMQISSILDDPVTCSGDLLQQQQQGQHALCNGGSGAPAAVVGRYSQEAAYPAGFNNIHQQLQQTAENTVLTHEPSLKGLLPGSIWQQQDGVLGSKDNSMPHADALEHSSEGRVVSAQAETTAAPGGEGSIISLSPAATDCLIALGLASRLAGVTDACRVSKPAAAAASGGGCLMTQLLENIGAPWAAEAADAEGCRRSGGGQHGRGYDIVPVVCRLVEGPDGLPRYKLDEDHIRRVQPSLVVVACEENSEEDEQQQLQQHQQYKQAVAVHSKSQMHFGQGNNAHGSSSLNGAVAMPGRVRLQVAVVQRVLQRAGVLWPEHRAVVLYQRCHSLTEVLEFMLVLANAAGVPERGLQLVHGLRAKLRAATARMYTISRLVSDAGNSSSNTNRSSTSRKGAVAELKPTVMVLEGVSPLRLSGFWVPEMLQLAGAKQAAVTPAPAEPPCSITWPQLRAAAPDILVLVIPGLDANQAAAHTADLAALPGFWSVPAVRSGAVYVCDHTLLARPGPGVVVGVELLSHMAAPHSQPLPTGLSMGSVLKLGLHSGQRCRPRLVPNYFSRYC